MCETSNSPPPSGPRDARPGFPSDTGSASPIRRTAPSSPTTGDGSRSGPSSAAAVPRGRIGTSPSAAASGPRRVFRCPMNHGFVASPAEPPECVSQAQQKLMRQLRDVEFLHRNRPVNLLLEIALVEHQVSVREVLDPAAHGAGAVLRRQEQPPLLRAGRPAVRVPAR